MMVLLDFAVAIRCTRPSKKLDLWVVRQSGRPPTTMDGFAAGDWVTFESVAKSSDHRFKLIRVETLGLRLA